MAVTKHWLAGTRQGQLDMGLAWVRVLAEQTDDLRGQAVRKWSLWSIPQEAVANLGERAEDAQRALDEAKNDETRTKVVNRKVATMFAALTEAMRSMKKRYFHVPPLTDADLVSLGLKVPDTSHTQTGNPTAQATIETFLVGRRQLGLKFVYVSGDSGDPANKSFRVYYRVAAPGEKAPEAPEELAMSFSEKRKTRVLDFEFGDSGKTAHFCVQIENNGRKGPWGPMISSVIP